MDKYLRFFIIISSVLLIISILYPIIIFNSFGDWVKIGTFGDSFGALNALFSGLALTGVIVTILIQKTELKNQRTELELQREEMAETREEFLINRTTNIVYQQLERFERALLDFTINIEFDSSYLGENAIIELDKLKKSSPTYHHDLLEEENLELKKVSLSKMSRVHNYNESSIQRLAYSLYNSVNALQGLFYKSSLDPEQINNLRNTFFNNIGFITMGVIENICFTQNEKLQVFETEDYLRFKLDVGKMTSTNIFLEPIIDFYHTRITKDNFHTLSEKWLKKQGGAY
jgi:hypothetical protein